jgi:hypothetical protein
MSQNEIAKRNQRLEITPNNDTRKPAFSEYRIHGHSSGRAGGISHQGINRGYGTNIVFSMINNDSHCAR